jgi:hypothetical protein
MKRTSIASAVSVAAGHHPAAAPAVDKPTTTRMVSANFHPRVVRSLRQLRLVPENDGKTMKDLLGEAINDLCVKYKLAQPYLPGERVARGR